MKNQVQRIWLNEQLIALWLEYKSSSVKSNEKMHIPRARKSSESDSKPIVATWAQGEKQDLRRTSTEAKV
jgi:hypothetical protein